MAHSKHISNIEYIPLQDTAVKTSRDGSSNRRRGFTGWRSGVRIAAITTICVLLLNTTLTIYAALKFGTTGGLGTAYEGSCSTVTTSATWLHVLINILGSVLLAASNYSMQCLAAPTREECDRAHAAGQWLDIGVLSIRNIFKLNRGRIVLWLVLAITSLPIHLLYNSTVFETVSTNYYKAFVVDDGFLGGLPLVFSFHSKVEDITASFHPQQAFDLQESYLVNGSTWRNLTMEQCIETYATDYVQDFNNVLLVQPSFNASFGHVYSDVMGPNIGVLDLFQQYNLPPYYWLCTSGAAASACSRANLLATASYFHMYTRPIAYCMAEQPPSHCQLQFSTTLLTVVIACNFVKAAIMLFLLLRRSTPTLVVLGDAIASFLNRPATDIDRPLGKSDVLDSTVSRRYDTQRLKKCSFDPRRTPARWATAASVSQWVFFVLLSIITIGTTIALLLLAINTVAFYLKSTSPFVNGFGTMSASAIITRLFRGRDDDSKTTLAIILANCPQLVMSCAYLLLNALFTVMLLAHEWSGFAVKPRSLRVTAPVGQQRSTYWLSLPMMYSVPLITLSALLHWLISQALFLTRVEARTVGYTSNVWLNSTVGRWPPTASNLTFQQSSNATFGDPVVIYPNHTHVESTYANDIQSVSSALGYSPAPILVVVLLGAALLLSTLACGVFRRFQSNMPVVSSCSLAIAAACHPPDADHGCSTKPLQWGELEQRYTLTSVDVESTDIVKRPWTLGRLRWRPRKNRTDPASEALRGSRPDSAD